MMISTPLSAVGGQVVRLGERLATLVVPSTCLTCERFVTRQGGCCAQCWQQLRFIRKPYCPVMGSPFSIDMGADFQCAEAIADPPPFDRLRAVMLYDKLARRLVSSLKYADRTDLVPALAEWMKVAGQPLLEEAEMIVPVPLHPARLRERRFNQSADLARHIVWESEVRFEPEILLRRKPTRQQVGLSERERARNVSGAFVVPKHKAIRLKGRHVVLVDDVYTTGATAKAATRALKRAGAARVDVLVFAKVETGEV